MDEVWKVIKELLITGGPGTGKTVIDFHHLKKMVFTVFMK